MAKILLVEDEDSIRAFLKINLVRNSFDVIEANNGNEGVRLALLEKPDLAILDVMMPGLDGFQVCEKLRESFPSMGIIMLTAKGQDMDKIMGLEFGADDYIVKPFNPLEVVLRVKAILRRVEKTDSKEDESELKRGPFTMNLYSQAVYKDGIEIDLTPKEFMILKMFIENPSKAFSRDELLNLVWGYNYFGDPKIIDVNIRRLRAKIEDDPSAPKYIETIWGMGYRWKKGENEKE